MGLDTCDRARGRWDGAHELLTGLALGAALAALSAFWWLWANLHG